MNPNNRFISPTEDFNRSGGEGVMNVNVVGNMNEISNRTTDRLFQSVSESPQSSELIVSARSRTVGTPFNFTTDIGGPLHRGRTARLAAVINPAIPNINRSNNQVTMYVAHNTFTGDGDVNGFDTANRIPLTFTIPYGYYTPSRFADVFSNLVTKAYTSFQLSTNSTVSQLSLGTIGSADVHVLSFTQLYAICVDDPETFRLSISVHATETTYLPTSGTAFTVPGIDLSFWFDSECSFIKRGIHMVPYPSSSDAVTTFTSKSQLPAERSIDRDTSTRTYEYMNSFPASYYYSRFSTITSQNLSLYTFGESRVDRTDAGGGGGKIIGVFTTARYNGNGSAPFGGLDVTKGVEAPYLGIRNAQLKLNELIDFQVQDEFGINLDEVFAADNVSGPTLAFNITY